MTKQTSNKPQF